MKPIKQIVNVIDTQKYAYLLDDGTIVPDPETGKEYIVLMRISGGEKQRIILSGASGACKEHLKEPYYLVEFCSGHKQIRYTYPAEYCEFCSKIYSSLMLYGANLEEANLERAVYNKYTTFSEGFKIPESMILV